MPNSIRIIIVAIVGFLFSIATLEIDVFDYDNTFFDSYDSYVHVDNQVSPQGSSVEQDCVAFSEITPSSLFSLIVKIPTVYKGWSLPFRPHKRKLYLIKSSLLI